MKRYDLEYLSKEFAKHHKEAVKGRQKARKEFPEANWPKDEFCICKALKCIVDELMNIKEKLNSK